MPKLDVEIINPFIESTLTTLRVQCSTEALAGKMFLKGRGQEISPVIMAVLGIMCPQFRGSMAISFPERTFLKVMGGMLGETFNKITPDLEDGAGELLNIIFGSGKRVLAEKGFNLERAVPTVIKGEGIKLKQMSKNLAIVLPFSSIDTPGFQIEISFDED